MISRVAQWLRRLANPTSASPVPIGMVTSPLEAAGERGGRAVVEKLVRRQDIAAIGAALERFLADERGTLALKKGLHILIEERIRTLAMIADPPQAHGFSAMPLAVNAHALDPEAARALGIASGPGAGGWTWAIAAMLQAAALAARTIAIGGAAGRVPTAKRYRVGAPAFADAPYWSPIRRAIAEAGHAATGAIAVVVEGGYDIDPGPEIARVDASRCEVDGKRWRSEVLIPSLVLCATVVAAVIRRPSDPVRAIAAWLVLQLARSTLDFQRALHAVRFDVYLDITEYAATHVVKAAMLERTGGRLVRWPHCYLDNPGAALSYLGYHLFLGTGPYEATHYAGSWSRQCRSGVAGFFKNDERWTESDDQLSPAYAEFVAARLSRGQRLLAYFSPSAVPGLERVVGDTLAAVLRALERRRDWFVVVKAKRYRSYRQLRQILETDQIRPLVDRLRDEGRLLIVEYGETGAEVCPAGWLIQHMTGGVGLGSVQLEALTQNKPVFAYMPVGQDTPLQHQLAASGLWHSDILAFEKALERWLADTDSSYIPYSWFRENFDPFGDRRALDRIVDVLFGNDDRRALHRLDLAQAVNT